MKDKFYCCRFCLACVQRAIRIIVRFSADMVSNPFNPKKPKLNSSPGTFKKKKKKITRKCFKNLYKFFFM